MIRTLIPVLLLIAFFVFQRSLAVGQVARGKKPKVSDVSDQSTVEDNPTGDIPFTVEDIETAPSKLMIDSSSSNKQLVPDSNILISGSDKNRFVKVIPAPDLSGTTTITLGVTDEDGNRATDTFSFTVSPQNDAPTITTIANQHMTAASPGTEISFRVEDAETPSPTLSVRFGSSSEGVVPTSKMVLSGTGADRTLSVAPAGLAGASAVSVEVMDTEGSTSTATFVVTVSSEKRGADEEDSKIVAARISFWGTLLAAMLGLGGTILLGVVAFVGHKYKKAMDDATLLLRRSEEERQRLATFVESIGLLSTKDGQTVSPAQHAAVLYVLARSNELRFALTLLDSIWEAGQIASVSAVWVVNEALELEELTQQDAREKELVKEQHTRGAVMLDDNASSLALRDGAYAWPSCLHGKWRVDLNIDARESLLRALLRVVTVHARDSWNKDQLTSVFINLYQIWKLDEDHGLKEGAVRACDVLIDVLAKKYESIPIDKKDLKVVDLKAEFQKELARLQEFDEYFASATVIERVEELPAWASA